MVSGYVFIFHPAIAIQYNTIQYNTIQYNAIQYNTIQYNTIQYNTIPCNAWYEIESRDILKARINFTGSAKKA